jgi:histidinol phosphatase-like enzyme
MKLNNIIILDLDGVLITTPQWRPDTMHDDGYTDFNPDCVERLNELIESNGYSIVLSSDRRRGCSIEKMNERFKSRGVKTSIIAYVPDYNEGTTDVWLNRREEIEMFLSEYKPKNYIILDDDKSLSDASEEIKSNWIQTCMLIGFKGIN